MKKTVAIYLILCLAFAWMALELYAAANGTVNNTTTRVQVGPKGTDMVLFDGQTTTTVATDSIGIHYTKAMYIADFIGSTTYAYFFLDMYNADGTEDCNVSVEYCFDPADNAWVAGAANSGVIKDNLTTTAVTDTLNVIDASNDTNFNIYPWMRLKFDYQAGNPTGTYVWWYVRLFKPTDVRYPSTNSLITSYATS